jgi:putative copper export protein
LLPTHDIAAMSLRTLGFIAGVHAAGISLFILLVGAMNLKSVPSIRRCGMISAGAGLMATIAHYAIEPARMAGSLSAIFDPFLHSILLDSNIALAAIARAVGLVFIMLGLWKNGRVGQSSALLGVMLFALSFSLVGHTVGHEYRWLLAVLITGHLLVVAFWFGSLYPMIIVSNRDATTILSTVIDRFSDVAKWLVPLIFVFGLIMSIVLLGGWENLRTPYGVLLIAKIAAFTLLLGLASLNKWRFGPAIAKSSGAAVIAFRRTVKAEWCLIAMVLAVTAWMTGLFSPTH